MLFTYLFLFRDGYDDYYRLETVISAISKLLSAWMYAITSSDCKLDRDSSENYGHSNTLVEYICWMLHYYFRDQKGLRSFPFVF